MKKLGLILLIMVVSLVLSLNTTVASATDKQNNDTALSEEDMNSILKEKGYNESDINSASLDTKKKLVESGEKAEYEVEMVETYTSLDGNTYEVTEENEDKINKLRQNDLDSMSVNQSKMFSTSCVGLGCGFEGGKSDGTWSANTFVSKGRTLSNEYEYTFMTDFNWSSNVVANFTDTIATAWERDFTAVANTEGGYHYYIAPYGMEVMPVPNLESDIYGLKAKFNIAGQKDAGGISQTLRVPKSSTGTTSSLVGAYAHPYSPVEIGFSIGPASITNKEFWGDKWTWRVNVTIGE
ncbi:hypothetical protein [Terribacillus saccharophilus]|uniref:hypothetical protein n=1 Tax=Terribacillus saccharophilus TaxID=361277 RepID=UPI002DD269AE|nr:hypothetical protein [Terribacillus saccharophilus]